MTTADHLEQLRADVRHRGERLALYRAKVYGPRATSPARLAELTREHERAVSSLKRAAESTKLAGRRSLT